MMRVLFDQQIFSEHVYGGVSRYFCSLAHALWKQGTAKPFVLSPLYVNQYLQELPSSVLLGVAVQSRPGTRRAICAASAGAARMMAPFFRPDIVHETYYSATPTVARGKPRVVTVFDMIHERCSGVFGAADQVRQAKVAAIERADHVLCISEHTRKDLIELLNVPEKKITVTYLAADVFQNPVPPDTDVVPAGHPYLLYVGGRFGYKNFDLLLKTWGRVSVLRDNFRLVCFGGGGFSPHERELMRELGVREGAVVQLAGSDAVLAGLYQHAAALVYPSLYEGFGIPPLEAMSMDCPVICSQATSIPEVVGNAGEYFDPASTESMEAALLSVLESNERRDELIEAGRQRIPEFSWSSCAQQTMRAYERVLA